MLQIQNLVSSLITCIPSYPSFSPQSCAQHQPSYTTTVYCPCPQKKTNQPTKLQGTAIEEKRSPSWPWNHVFGTRKKPAWQIGFRGVSERFDSSQMVNSIENGITKKKVLCKWARTFVVAILKTLKWELELWCSKKKWPLSDLVGEDDCNYTYQTAASRKLCSGTWFKVSRQQLVEVKEVGMDLPFLLTPAFFTGDLGVNALVSWITWS